MSRNGIVATVACALAALSFAACSTQVPGTAEPGADSAPGPTVVPPKSSSEKLEPALPGVGDCVAGNDMTPIDCSREHTVEITLAGTFGGDLPDTPPERAVVFETVFPTCRAEAARYLGNQAYDATTLGAWLLWADEDDWRAGKRWYRCGVAQLSPQGESAPRTGSVQGVLERGGLYDHQVCSATQPSKSVPQRVPCDQPHVGEAIGVVPMGKPTDPPPSEAEFNRSAKPACERLLTRYLARSRDDVFAAWRWPDATNWRHGFTNLTCYAETARPVAGSLRDVGAGPLPR